MKLKDLISEYGEYEVIDNIKFKAWDATLPEEKSASIQFESREGIQIRLEPPKPKTVWDLESGDKYFILYADGAAPEYEWRKDGYISKSYRDQGNVFLSKEKAEKDAERRAVETLLLKHGGRRWYKDNEYNFVIRYETEEKMLWVDSVGLPVQGTIYFDSIGDAMNAMRENGEIGAERIIKALFEVR